MKTPMNIIDPTFALFAFACFASSPGLQAAAIDATLYTKYSLDIPHTNVVWSVCGSLPGSSGCYGSGSLGGLLLADALNRGIV